MIPMNIKSKAGFTLVELIVVIAILGILAGIAVPAYSGYIKKAESAADLQALGSIKTAAETACVLEGSVAKIEVSTTTKNVTGVKIHVGEAGTVDHNLSYNTTDKVWTCGSHGSDKCPVVDDFDTFMNDSTVTLNYYSAATLSGGDWTGTKAD